MKIFDGFTLKDKCKWIIYHGQTYYPSVEEFDTYEEALKAWNKLVEDNEDTDGDFLAQVKFSRKMMCMEW